MKRAIICLPIRDSKILLGMKKHREGGHNVGVGKWNGFGGRVEPDETSREAACRELQEEAGLIASADDCEEVGRITFLDGGVEVFDCAIFFIRKWSGAEHETDEMRPRWFNLAHIPYDE